MYIAAEIVVQIYIATVSKTADWLACFASMA